MVKTLLSIAIEIIAATFSISFIWAENPCLPAGREDGSPK
jgi:hypothetical protein